MWALGVTIYSYLYEALPFYAEQEEATIHMIVNNELSLPDINGVSLSDDCKSLLRGMLHKDPSIRMTIEQVVIHEWFLP